MSASITVKDVARVASVSVGTVSRVFNNHTNVTDDVRQRVLQAASELGYIKPRIPSRATGTTLKEIAFLYNPFHSGSDAPTNPFWSQVLHGVEREVRKANIKLNYCSISALRATPQLLRTTVQEQGADGLLLVGHADKATVTLLQSMDVPIVLVDCALTPPQVEAVLVDSFEGARQAVDYLIDVGHREIAMIGGVQERQARGQGTLFTIERRAHGYRTALYDAGLSVRPELFEGTRLDPEGGYTACQRLLARNVPFTALFCANDLIAMGALKALHEAGRRVPDDVSVIGFDDTEMSAHLIPSLTTVRVDRTALGAAAVKRLIARAADPETPCLTSFLEVSLVVRDSVRASPT